MAQLFTDYPLLRLGILLGLFALVAAGAYFVTGTFAGIEDDGALRLSVAGVEQVIRAGDVHLG